MTYAIMWDRLYSLMRRRGTEVWGSANGLEEERADWPSSPGADIFPSSGRGAVR